MISTTTLIIPTFIAGVLTFLAPCTLPLVPGYLAFISGVSPADVQDQIQRKRVHRIIMRNGLFYVLGFSAVFILLGSLFSIGGSALAQYRFWITRFGGVIIILLGLFLIVGNRWKWLSFLNSEKKLHISTALKPGSPGSSFIFGATFALGWTPCVGPILGTVFILASASATVLQGVGLLALFAAGLGIPFLLLAAFIGSATQYIRRINRYLGVISTVGGIFLIGIGFLLLFNQWDWWLGVAYNLFQFFHYEGLLNYL